MDNYDKFRLELISQLLQLRNIRGNIRYSMGSAMQHYTYLLMTKLYNGDRSYKDLPGIRETCAKLCIQHTRKGIREYLRSEPIADSRKIVESK